MTLCCVAIKADAKACFIMFSRTLNTKPEALGCKARGAQMQPCADFLSQLEYE